MKHVLITGATGVVGSELVPLCLAEPETVIHLLVRASSDEHLQERLGELKSYWGYSPETAGEMYSRIHSYRSDVCHRQFGLSDEVYRELSRCVSHVVHCAGNVKLNESLASARKSAVSSIQQIVSFSKLCVQQGQFQKLDVASTVGVAGRMSGHVPERRLHEPRSYRNTYEAAKAEAEEFLWREIELGLPATIHRPSMVVGDSCTGRVARFQVFYHLAELFSGRRTRGFLPKMGNSRLDLVPVDYVARAMHRSSESPEAIGRVFHLCSGPEGSIPLTELVLLVRHIYSQRGEALPPLRWLSRRWVGLLLNPLSLVVPPKMRRSLQSLPYFLAYLDEQQVFDTKDTFEFFGARGIPLPSIKSYLDSVLAFYCRSRQAASSSDPPEASTACDQNLHRLQPGGASGQAKRACFQVSKEA